MRFFLVSPIKEKHNLSKNEALKSIVIIKIHQKKAGKTYKTNKLILCVSMLSRSLKLFLYYFLPYFYKREKKIISLKIILQNIIQHLIAVDNLKNDNLKLKEKKKMFIFKP